MLLNKSLHVKNTAMALSLPNPWGKHPSLSSHSIHRYTYRRSLVGCRVIQRKRKLPWLVPTAYPLTQPTSYPYPPTYTLMLQFFWQLHPSICGEIANYRGNVIDQSVSTEGTWPSTAIPQDFIFDPPHVSLSTLSLGDYFHTHRT